MTNLNALNLTHLILKPQISISDYNSVKTSEFKVLV